MAVYTHLSEDEIQSLAAIYGIGHLERFDPIAEGVENSNYVLHTVAKKYILTIYERRVRQEDIPFYLATMEHFAARGIPCPQPLHARDGSADVAVGEKRAALVTFLEGRSVMEATLPQLASLGEMLARLHRAAEGMTLARTNALSLAGWREIAAKLGERCDDIQPGLTVTIAEELAYLQTHWPEPSTLPHGVVHADLFPDNVFFEGDAVSGVIDFYFACTDFFAYDLMITLNAWCFDAGHHHDAAKADALMQAYTAIRPLSADEKAALPVLARGAALRFLLTRAEAWLEHDENALVQRKDPLEYLAKLEFWQK